MLKYNEDEATMIYHVFTCFVYFFPLLGAIVSDSWLGKFNTILYVSMIYAVGELLLSASAAPPLHIPQRLVQIMHEVVTHDIKKTLKIIARASILEIKLNLKNKNDLNNRQQ